jgi:uncharacterized CHY-type Zn-finger protein
MESKFVMRDEKFKCDVCLKNVATLGYTARDHCPYCLSSKHVDNNPGDRACKCHGILKPVAIEPFKGSYKIVYKCAKCGQIKKNIMAKDDNMDLIINIMSNPVDVDNL